MDIYEQIRANLLEGETEEVERLVQKALRVRHSPESILNNGLIEGINILAQKFKTEMVLVPEALMAARALHVGLDTLAPYLTSNVKYRARVLIGTVEGDVHDIGKNIVKMMISTIGVEVVDLGVDVDTEAFIQGIKKYKPDILMLSAMLTTTMFEMKNIIENIKKENLRDDMVIFVGGFPVTRDYAKEIGADYYTEGAVEMRDFLNVNLDKIIRTR